MYYYTKVIFIAYSLNSIQQEICINTISVIHVVLTQYSYMPENNAV